jgi:hypothetical protein
MTTLVRTRLGLHAVAEQLLASDLQRQTGYIGLRYADGGFAQPEHVVAGGRRRLRVDGLDLVVLDKDTERRYRLTTLADAAAWAQTTLSFPTDVYEPATGSIGANDVLALDVTSAARLAASFALGATALEELRRCHADDEPTIAQLWSEHFDLACAFREINFGVSPGDADHDEPYLYVAPWQVGDDPDANEPWGRSLTVDADTTAADAVAFFGSGLTPAPR